jgi:hypothetical protein
VRRVCAWCGSDLGEKAPSGQQRTEAVAAKTPPSAPGEAKSRKVSDVISTICRQCADRLAAYRSPVLVVSREWARLYEELAELMRARPDIQVVLDRRQQKAGDQASSWDGPERRRADNPLKLA